LKCKDDPDTAVAVGACNFAASIWRPYDPTAPKLMLIETCPYNIGIAVKGKEMDIFFERGTTIPATKTFSYTTLYDRQRYAQIAVYEGNAEAVSENHKLGTFLMEIEPMPAGDLQQQLYICTKNDHPLQDYQKLMSRFPLILTAS
jgi:molecular chaperone DnaK (HSP70)